MRCANCGTEVPEKFKFCPECGTSVASTASRDSDVERDGAPKAGEDSLSDLRTMDIAGARRAVAPGVELSLGDLRTMEMVGGKPAVGPGAEVSVGEFLTLEGPGEGVSGGGGAAGVIGGRYEVLEELGRGGFAVVWKARDKKLGRTVAVKRLQIGMLKGASGEQTLARFRREAQAIAQLNHRNIVAVYDHDRDAEGDYIVMEYVGGGTLREYLKSKGGKLPVPEALEMIRGIAQGLAYAHRKNLVHRDIKPGNILLQRDPGPSSGEGLIPKIVDFGLARMGSESELSMSGYGMGTPYYMAPEQRRDAKSVNHTADIYALGKVLYELVTGDVPDNVDPEKIPSVPGLAQVIFRCVKTNPEERYFSVEEMLRDLEKVGSLSAKGAGKSAAQGNVCPACGAANPPEVKFCEACGVGLTRNCPECGRENSIHKQFCGGCGTDVEGFLKWQAALQQMEKHAEEKRWSLVLKEEAPAPRAIKLPGTKGRKIAERLQELKAQAEQEEQHATMLKDQFRAALNEGRLRDAYDQIREYLEVRPHDDTAKTILADVMPKLEQEEWLAVQAQIAQCEKNEAWGEAASALREYLLKWTGGTFADEARKQLSKYEKRERALQEAENNFTKAIQSGDFEEASKILVRLFSVPFSSQRVAALGQMLSTLQQEYRQLRSQIARIQVSGVDAEKSLSLVDSALRKFPRVSGWRALRDKLAELVEQIEEKRSQFEAYLKAADFPSASEELEKLKRLGIERGELKALKGKFNDSFLAFRQLNYQCDELLAHNKMDALKDKVEDALKLFPRCDQFITLKNDLDSSREDTPDDEFDPSQLSDAVDESSNSPHHGKTAETNVQQQASQKTGVWWRLNLVWWLFSTLGILWLPTYDFPTWILGVHFGVGLWVFITRLGGGPGKAFRAAVYCMNFIVFGFGCLALFIYLNIRLTLRLR